MFRSSLRLAFGLSFVVLAACGPSRIDVDGSLPVLDGGTPPDGGRVFPDSGIGITGLSLARVVPNHGSFLGGNEVVLRGSGYDDNVQAAFGGHDVQPADHRLIDNRRVAVIVPAGAVGTVDVTATVGSETVTLQNGYTYENLDVRPNSGAVAGGTFITLTGSGTDFRDGDQVYLGRDTFGRNQCRNLTVVSPTIITCRTPPGTAGTVGVYVRRGDTAVASAEDAFTYFDSTDPFAGGLGGGPSDGTINVTVLDAASGNAVADAYVIVGQDISPANPHQGLTDSMGQITFSGPEIVAPVTVTAAKFCYEKTSFVSFDARDVTIFLVPWQDPMCGMGAGMPPTGRPRNGSFIAGELIWARDFGTGPTPWFNVPEPRDGWTRVAYVYTTERAIGIPNPDPAGGGTTQRVLESPQGTLGYPYSIFARPGGLAVYALAGLENPTQGRFIPYVMGIARNVLVGPGETRDGVNIYMDIPLDHYLEVQVGTLPPTTPNSPDSFLSTAHIDLGGEGIIVRRDSLQQPSEVVRTRDVSRSFRFTPEPSLERALADGRFRVEVSWNSGDFFNTDPTQGRYFYYDYFTPYSSALETGVTAIDDVLHVEGILDVPVPTDPADGSFLPDDRVLRWTEAGPDPSFYVILMVGFDGNPAWRLFVPGTERSAPIPDLGTIDGIDDIPSGFVTWGMFAVTVPGFDFNTFRYSYLADQYWSRWAVRFMTAQR